MQEIIAELTQQDPILRELIARGPVQCIQSTKQVFHDVMSCLIEQQIHYRSTKHIFEKALATKLINKTLKKTAIAYHIANAIDEDLSKAVRTIQNVDDANDAVNYLVKAIKYATSN
jgi:hypothetical protein